jgi:hypothetical protein
MSGLPAATPQGQDEGVRKSAHPCMIDLITFWWREKEKAVQICAALLPERNRVEDRRHLR